MITIVAVYKVSYLKDMLGVFAKDKKGISHAVYVSIKLLMQNS